MNLFILIYEESDMARYNDYKYTRMPWGKYKGYFLKDLPDDYIKWAVMNMDDQAMAYMFGIELQRRQPKLR
jgi:hypothetical protein